MTQEQKEKLAELCKKFIADNDISCAEAIYQCEGVVLASPQFIESMCNIVGYADVDQEAD